MLQCTQLLAATCTTVDCAKAGTSGTEACGHGMYGMVGVESRLICPYMVIMSIYGNNQ